MLPSNPIETMNVYASQSQYVKGPDKAAQAAGTVPLDTLPADWWNWLWKQITTRINEASNGMGSVYNEILSVLEAASITPSETSTTDLVNAIKAIAHTIGSSTTAGAVKSSATSGYIAIDADGYMTPNGMGVPTSLNTVSKQVVGAINEVLASFNSYKTTNDRAITGLDNSKAPNNHASTETTYGVGSSTNYGHVKLSDSYNTETPKSANEGVGASQKALYEAYTELRGSILVIPVGLIFPFAGPKTAIPAGYLLCDGQAVLRESYPDLFRLIGVTYGVGDGITTFNVPDYREAVLVGSEQRASGIMIHDVYALGEFKDDQIQNITGHVASSESSSFQEAGDMGAFQGSVRVNDWGTGTAGSHQRLGRIPKLDFDASKVARAGTTTHGKQIGVNYIIKC